MSLPVWIPGSDPSLNLVRILSFSSFTSRTLSILPLLLFLSEVTNCACQLIALSDNCSVDVKECDELTRAVRNLKKEQQ